jgi:2-polyprenyl-6-methoxyphenol hydroxylase-like FAD-dependent oxidoreductase
MTPRIIDRDSGPSPQSRALAVNPRTLELLEPCGATERMLARGNRIRHMIVRTPERELFRFEMRYLPHRFDFLLALAQSETERILSELLAEGGNPVEWNTELSGLRPDGDRFRCQIGTEDAAYDTVVGADGAHSTVRKALDIGFAGESLPEAWGLADVDLEAWPFPWDSAVATLADDYVCAFFPLREGFGRFVTSRTDILNSLPRDARIGKVHWQSEFHISYRQVATYQSGNAYLAGDAAHIHSPVGGRGMNLGIEDAAWLAYLLCEGRAGQYTQLRHGPGAQVLKMTSAPTQLLASRSLWARTLRTVILPALLGVPAVQRRLLPRMAGLDTPPPPWLGHFPSKP